MSKRVDPDLKALAQACRALHMTSKRMRRPALEFLWDKFVRHGEGLPEPKPILRVVEKKRAS